MEQVLNLKMSDKNMTDNSNTHAKCNDCGGLRQFTHNWDGERYFFVIGVNVSYEILECMVIGVIKDPSKI